MGEVRSIQGIGIATAIPLTYLKCIAHHRHDLDGNVFEEQHNHRKVWVARLQCTRCGTRRVTRYSPVRCEQIGGHEYYDRPVDYDTSVTAIEARKIMFKNLLVKERKEA